MTASNVNMGRWPHRTPQNMCMYDLEYTEHSNLIAYCLNEFSTPGQKFGEKTQIHRLSLIHTHSHVHSDSLVTQVTPERHRH